jgi:cytosine deaminase
VGDTPFDLVFREARLSGHDDLVDVAIVDGRIQTIGPQLEGPRRGELHVDGRILSPGFVDLHMHLDKALTTEFRPNVSGTLDEARRIFRDYKASATVEDIAARARKLARMALRHGTTAIRTHADVDQNWGLRSVEALLAVRDAFRGVLDLQVVAFPTGFMDVLDDEGLGTVRRALEMGADLVGGLPTFSKDPARHCDRLLALAREFDRDVDMHVDESGNPDDLAIVELCRATRAHGYEGRVTAGHLCSLGAVEPARADEVIAQIADAGITVVTLPSCNLYLQGREDLTRVRRGVTRVRQMLERGITVCYASDNVRDAFNPFGNADMLEGGLLMAHAAHLGDLAGFRHVLAMATTNPGRAFYRGKPHALAPGAPADLVILDETDPDRIMVTQPEKLKVYKAGRLVAENERRSRLSGGPST